MSQPAAEGTPLTDALQRTYEHESTCAEVFKLARTLERELSALVHDMERLYDSLNKEASARVEAEDKLTVALAANNAVTTEMLHEAQEHDETRAKLAAAQEGAARWKFVLRNMVHQKCGPYVGWTLDELFPGDDPERAIDYALRHEYGRGARAERKEPSK